MYFLSFVFCVATHDSEDLDKISVDSVPSSNFVPFQWTSSVPHKYLCLLRWARTADLQRFPVGVFIFWAPCSLSPTDALPRRYGVFFRPFLAHTIITLLSVWWNHRMKPMWPLYQNQMLSNAKPTAQVGNGAEVFSAAKITVAAPPIDGFH